MRDQIFISYAHVDNESPDASKRWLNRLLEQLEPLRVQGQVKVWSDQEIEMGDDWHPHIQTSLNQAKAAVLLVSPAFLASKYIRNSELPVLLKNVKDQGVLVLPVILRPCLFAETKFKYPESTKGPQEFWAASTKFARIYESSQGGWAVLSDRTRPSHEGGEYLHAGAGSSERRNG